MTTDVNYFDKVLWNNPFSRDNQLLLEIRQLKKQLFELANSVNVLQTSKEDEDQLITQKEACKLLGRDETTLYRYRKNKILPYMRLAGVGIRYKKADVLNLLKTVNND